MNNFFSLSWHLVRKDIRHQWMFLIGLGLLALLIPLWSLIPTYNNTKEENWILIAAFYLLGLLILIRLIQLDPPTRVVHFLSTRAVPWLPLVSSKIIFVFLFLMIPVWVARLLTIFSAGIAYNVNDVALFLIESGASVGACIGMVALFSMIFRKISTVIVALLIFGVIIDSLFIVSSNIVMPVGYGVMVGSALFLLKIVINILSCFCLTTLGNIACILIFVGAALLRYRYRSFVALLIPLLMGIVLSFILNKIVINPQFSLMSKEDLGFLEDLKPVFPHKTLYTTTMGSDYSINASLSLTGFKAPYFGNNLSLLNAQATLESGRVIKMANNPDIQDLSEVEPIPPLNLKRHLVSIPSQVGMPLYPQQVPLFHFQTSDLHSGETLATKLSGEVSMNVYRAELLPIQLPIESGASMMCERRRYTIQKVNVDENTVEFQLDAYNAPLSLMGDNDTLVELVYNPGTSESLTPVGGNEYFQEGIFIKHLTDIHRYAYTRILPPGVAKPDMRIWVKGARIAFFAIHNLGNPTFPFEMTNVSLLPSH